MILLRRLVFGGDCLLYCREEEKLCWRWEKGGTREYVILDNGNGIISCLRFIFVVMMFRNARVIEQVMIHFLIGKVYGIILLMGFFSIDGSKSLSHYLLFERLKFVLKRGTVAYVLHRKRLFF